MAEPIRVIVTGAAGQIAYSLLYNIAKGDVFGPAQPMVLVLVDIKPMMSVVEGVVLELQDCALPLVQGVESTDSPTVAFKDADVAFMVGAMPRREGMERKDLLKANAGIFKEQGKAIDSQAKKTIKVLVVGNPANTNALITQVNAPSISPRNFSALTRLDQNRAQAQIASRLGVPCNAVKNVTIWGNHSSTQYPDASHGTVTMPCGTSKNVSEALNNDAWLKGEFIKTVQTRGGAIIKARKLSSAMSAAKAICDHMRDWWCGTKEGEWVSMGVMSDGSYNVPQGIIYSFPVQIKDKEWTIVKNLSISDFSREKMDATATELLEEKVEALGD